MMREPTTDHDEIRRWAAFHRATPAEVIPRVFDGKPAILGFLFVNASQPATELRPMSWNSFFSAFDLLELCFPYDDTPAYEFSWIDKIGPTDSSAISPDRK